MRTIRISALLFALAPALALAQGPDSIRVEHNGVQYPGYGATFGARFPQPGTTIGPDTLVHVAGSGETAPAGQGCDPLVNADEVEGNIAMVERGTCTFVLKVQNAVAAGAAAVIVYNDVDDKPGIVVMGGECEPDVCSVPAVFISYRSGLNILAELESPKIVTLIPIRVTEPPPPPSVGTHNTGVVQFDVTDYGFLGTDAQFDGTGFVFNGEQGLFVSSVLVGIDGEVVSNPYRGGSEWTAVSEVTPIAPPFPAPFDHFDQGFVTAFENADLGIRVMERSYSRENDPYVIVKLEVENISGSDISDAYLGLFADFDAGTTWDDDAAGFEQNLNLVYVFDPVEAAPFFGLVAITAPDLSGYSTVAATADDAQLWEALTSEVEISPDPAQRAVVIGTGPYAIAAGTNAVALFAFVGGTDIEDLLVTAQGFFVIIDSAEATTPEGTFVLGSAYPNPFAQGTTIPFDLPTAQRVRLAVYDVLGREVAVLVDGPRPAGEQAVAFDAAALPSGVYLVRLEAGAMRLTQALTVVR
ncbi:MAG: PA domain-containing protein [Rhodothermales bacterium]